MRIAFVTRSTLLAVPGGDTIQVNQTAKELRELGITIDVLLTHEKIDYSLYDAFHFFNLIRPADIVPHLAYINKPIFLTPILVDYSEYDRLHRKGLSGSILKLFPGEGAEYIKTIGRGLLGKDRLPSMNYIVKGQKSSIKKILRRTAAVLPNSMGEYQSLVDRYGIEKDFAIIPNGIDPFVFSESLGIQNPKSGIRNPEFRLVCVARIEGIKNQLNLIKAINNTAFHLTLIGRAAPNQQQYYNECKKISASNIQFIDHLSQEELLEHYLQSKVHILPSWFETCGLSSLEAAAMGCNIVITDKGFPREYFGDKAFYCDPANPASILEAVKKASSTSFDPSLREKIYQQYTWPLAAKATLSAYQNHLQ